MHNEDTSTKESIFSVEEDVVQSYVSDTSPLPSEKSEISTTTKYDVAVFQNNEAAEDETSDVVCNGGLDIGAWLLSI